MRASSAAVTLVVDGRQVGDAARQIEQFEYRHDAAIAKDGGTGDGDVQHLPVDVFDDDFEAVEDAVHVEGDWFAACVDEQHRRALSLPRRRCVLPRFEAGAEVVARR